ncbi:hypothetical protein D3C87_1429330 [compost metagenome]
MRQQGGSGDRPDLLAILDREAAKREEALGQGIGATGFVTQIIAILAPDDVQQRDQPVIEQVEKVLDRARRRFRFDDPFGIGSRQGRGGAVEPEEIDPYIQPVGGLVV